MVEQWDIIVCKVERTYDQGAAYAVRTNVALRMGMVWSSWHPDGTRKKVSQHEVENVRYLLYKGVILESLAKMGVRRWDNLLEDYNGGRGCRYHVFCCAQGSCRQK